MSGVARRYALAAIPAAASAGFMLWSLLLKALELYQARPCRTHGLWIRKTHFHGGFWLHQWCPQRCAAGGDVSRVDRLPFLRRRQSTRSWRCTVGQTLCCFRWCWTVPPLQEISCRQVALQGLP